MKDFITTQNDEGLRLDRFIGKLLPHLPPSLIQKSLRQNKVRVNGVRQSSAAARLGAGDTVTLYYRPELFAVTPETNPDAPGITIVYEDEHLLVLDKPAGQSVHDDDHGSDNTLIAGALKYLTDTSAWNPKVENAFKPALCHRIDRNTSGLVMVAKTHAAQVVLAEKIRGREIKKRYLCRVNGKLSPKSGTFSDYLLRNPDESLVTVYASPVPAAKTAVTHYKVLSYDGDTSLAECLLETGRTHQIRAQFAFHGYPLIGDGKYGKLKPGGPNVQQLCAHSLTFDFVTPSGALEYLKGRTIKLNREPF